MHSDPSLGELGVGSLSALVIREPAGLSRTRNEGGSSAHVPRIRATLYYVPPRRYSTVPGFWSEAAQGPLHVGCRSVRLSLAEPPHFEQWSSQTPLTGWYLRLNESYRPRASRRENVVAGNPPRPRGQRGIIEAGSGSARNRFSLAPAATAAGCRGTTTCALSAAGAASAVVAKGAVGPARVLVTAGPGADGGSGEGSIGADTAATGTDAAGELKGGNGISECGYADLHAGRTASKHRPSATLRLGTRSSICFDCQNPKANAPRGARGLESGGGVLAAEREK